MRRLWLTVAVATLAAAFVPVAYASPPGAGRPVPGHGTQPNLGLGIKLLDASVARRNDPRARIEIDDFVHPGTTLIRHVLVSDFTPKPMHVLVYPAPARITGEQFVIAPRGAASELTGWIRVTPATLNLAPESSATVTVQIDVPGNAVAGERYGAVVAELGAAKPKPGQVTIASRVGVRIYLDVGSGGEPPSNFRISTLTPERLPDGRPAVSAQVTNTGQRALDLSGSLTLSHGPGGLRAGPFPVPEIPTLGIGQRGNVVVPLDRQTPRGPWLARMQLQSGYVTHAVQARIVFPVVAGKAGHPVPVTPVPLIRDRNLLVPIALGLIVLLALLLLWVWWRRRRRDREAEPSPPARIPAPRPPGDRSAPASAPHGSEE